MNQRSFPMLFKASAGLLFLVLLVLVLYYGADVLALLGFAILISYLLYPLTSRMEGKKIPRGVANITGIILFMGLFGLIFFLLYKQGSLLMNDFSEIKNQAKDNIAQMENFLETNLPFVPYQENGWLVNRVQGFLNAGQSTFKNAFATTASTIGKSFLLPFFTFYMLYYRERLRNFVLDLVTDDQKELTKDILGKISTVTTRYMIGVLTVTTILSVLTASGLLIIGLKYAVILGIIAGLFNLIPYFGTFIGGSVPLAMALLTMDSPKYALFVAILIIVLQFFENNVLTPNITGSRVRLNPLFTLISILLGALLWGIVGMFLAVPFMGMFKIVCENVDTLKPISRLIGTEERSGLGAKVERATGKLADKVKDKAKDILGSSG